MDLYPYQFFKVLLLYVARRGEKKNVYWILMGKSERKRTLGKPRRICEDNIKADLNMERRAWTGLFWLRILTGGSLL